MACDACPHGYKGLDGRGQPECHDCEKRSTHRWLYMSLALFVPFCEQPKGHADKGTLAKQALECVEYIDKLPDEAPPWEDGTTIVELMREMKGAKKLLDARLN